MTVARVSPARAQQLLAAQIDGAFGSAGRPYTVAWVVLIGSCVQGAILWNSSPHERILLWVALVTLCQLGSMLLIAAYRRRVPAQTQLSFWGRCKVVQTSLLSLAWGSCVILLYVPGVPATLLVPAMSVVCVTVASTVTNANYPPGMYPLLIGNCAPGMIYLLGFADGKPDAIAAGFALMALLVIVVVGGVMVSRLIRDTLLTRMELADAVGIAETARKKTAVFFSAASHDLRQPLHALGLYSGLLRKNPVESERRSLIESIESCVDGIERLFNGIMGVSESELLQSRLMPAAVALQPVIEKVLRGFETQVKEKNLQIRSVRTSLWVTTDAAALERILSNLLANAIRYTERGKIVVGVRRRQTHCELIVADTGVGIAESLHQRIFDELYQVGNPERNRQKGFGLGLSIVKRLCEALGTTVAVRSAVGKGSLFSVRLERAHPQKIVADEPQTLTPSHPLHVLLVEDDELVRDATLRTLHEWQQPAQACATGAEALAILLANRHPHWHVLLDYRLADGENGIALADKIREQIQPAPIISMLTGEADDALLEAAARRGISVLAKPLKPLRLRALLYARKPSPA